MSVESSAKGKALSEQFEFELFAFKESLAKVASETRSVERFTKIIELLVWADRNDQRIVEFFIEANLLYYFIALCERATNAPNRREQQIALIKLFSFFVLNIRSKELVNFAYSHRNFNDFLAFPFDAFDDEIAAFYVTMAKSVCQRFAAFPLQIFYNARRLDFPLFTRVARFFAHRDALVRATTFNALLTIARSPTRAAELLSEFPYNLFFAEFADRLRTRLRLGDAGEEAFLERYAECESLAEFLLEFLKTENRAFTEMVTNCYYSYAFLPLFAAVQSDYGAVSGFLLLFKALRGTSLYARAVDTFLSPSLPRALLENLPPLPDLCQLSAAAQCPFALAHMRAVHARLFGAAANDQCAPPPLTPEKLAYFANLSRGSGVPALCFERGEVAGAALDAPLRLFARQPNCENFTLENILTQMTAQEKPPLGGLLLLSELLGAAKGYAQLKGFCSPGVIARLGLLLDLFIRNRSTRRAFHELTSLIDSLLHKVPEATPSIHSMLVAAFRPLFAFFFDYDLKRGLTRLCLFLEDELCFRPTLLSFEGPRALGLYCHILAPTANERETFNGPRNGERGRLRSNVTAFVCLARVLERHFLAETRCSFETMYADFYAQFPALECRPDTRCLIGPATLSPISIKVREGGQTVKLDCFMLLGEANLLIVDAVVDNTANVLINIKYKSFRVEEKPPSKVLLSFYAKLAGLLLFFETEEGAHNAYTQIREAQRAFYLAELRFFSARLQSLKADLNL